MIGQVKVLLRVKQLREEQAFRAMMLKRAQLAEAEAALERAKAAVEDSASTLRSREDAIYAGVLGTVVGLDGLDELRGQVVQLEQGHTRLKDAQERSAHVRHRVDGELAQARQGHQVAVRARDKFGMITDELVREADEAASAKEENEVEELFARPRGRIE
jgi:hypothetical protein